MSTWDEAREAKLRELWEKGHTASQIAKILGDTTRNAVIGKAHRLKLAGRTQSKNKEKQKKQVISVQSKEERYISRRSRFKSLLLDKNFEPENPKKLEELDDKNCRWPIGHPDEENFYFSWPLCHVICDICKHRRHRPQLGSNHIPTSYC